VLIGATAHYVITGLGNGPIMDQQQVEVDHSMSTDEFAAAGREVEDRTLARAVRRHTENRSIRNGGCTVVLRRDKKCLPYAGKSVPQVIRATTG
jgi:formyltetrahydrofolate deformylase